MQYSVNYRNILTTTFLTIFRRFRTLSKDFRRFSKSCPNVRQSSPKISEGIRGRTDDVSIIQEHILVLLKGLCKHIAIVTFSVLKNNMVFFTCEDVMFTHKSSPRISLVFKINVVLQIKSNQRTFFLFKEESALRLWLVVKFFQYAFLSTAVACPALPAISNGRIFPSTCSSTGGKYTERCVYSCDNGYLLEGRSSRQCSEHGTWEGVQPSCKKSNKYFLCTSVLQKWNAPALSLSYRATSIHRRNKMAAANFTTIPCKSCKAHKVQGKLYFCNICQRANDNVHAKFE